VSVRLILKAATGGAVAYVIAVAILTVIGIVLHVVGV
jgi:hypothetical protein